MSDRAGSRLVVMRVLVLSLLLTLFGRAWFLQVLSHDTYVTKTADNSTRDTVTPAVRGIVVDAQGRPLITNVPALVITVLRRHLPAKKDAAYAVLARVSPLVGVPAGRLQAMIRSCGADPERPGHNVPAPCSVGEPSEPVPVRQLPDGDPRALHAAQVITENPQLFPGIDVERRAVRRFDQPGAARGTVLAAQTMGYVGPASPADFAAHPQWKPRGTDYDPRRTVGRGGLEQSYDADLRGTPGRRTVRVDVAGQQLGVLADSAPVQGADLVLNLDATVQKAAEEALGRAMATYAPASKSASHPQTGAAVVMTTDGRVVALASTPSFDPSVFFPSISTEDYAALQDPANGLPLNNKAVDGEYAPGSAYKPVAASTMLGNGLVNPGERLDCPPVLPVGNQDFHNFEGEAPHSGDLRYMLEVSCDTVFDRYAFKQWIDDGSLRQTAAQQERPAKELFAKMAKAYGFGSSPGIDLPGGGSAGAVVDRATRLAQYKAPRGPLSKAYNCKRQTQVPSGSYEYNLAHETCSDGFVLRGGEATQSAIGQGSLLQVTPLQMARAYAAVANGGTLYEPTVAQAVVRSDGTVVRTITPKKAGTVPVSADELDYIRQGLFQVTHGKDGTGYEVFKGFPVPIAGKTGTAEVEKIVDGVLKPVGDNAWFMSFGPYSPGSGTSAKYVVGVVIPGSGQGGQIAAPAVRDIWSAIYGVQGAKVANPHAGAPARLPCFRADHVLPGAPGRCASAPARVRGIPVQPPAPSASASPAGGGGASNPQATGALLAVVPPRPLTGRP